MAHPGGLFSFSRGREAPADKDGSTYLRVVFLRFRKDSLLCTAWVCFGPCFCRVPHGGFCLDQLVGLTGHVLLP